jgi:hypothetical protein
MGTQSNISSAPGSCGRSQKTAKYQGKCRQSCVRRSRRRRHRNSHIAARSRGRRIPISAIGVGPPPAANPLPGVRPAAAEFAAAPAGIRRGHTGEPQGTCRGASADYRVEERLLLRSHLIVTAIAVAGMHCAVLNQFAQLGIFRVEPARELEFIARRSDARRVDAPRSDARRSDARRSDARRSDARSIHSGRFGM